MTAVEFGEKWELIVEREGWGFNFYYPRHSGVAFSIDGNMIVVKKKDFFSIEQLEDLLSVIKTEYPKKEVV